MQQNKTKLKPAPSRAREAFLAALAQTTGAAGSVPAAAAAAGVHRCTPYRWAQRDPAFAARWAAIAGALAAERWATLDRARQLRRAARNAELLPARQAQAARMRAAKRR